MKLLTVIKKNFKLLLRNKNSALVVLLGPLLIILIVGLAFSNLGSDYTLTVGVYSSSYSNATDNFVSSLEENYNINKFDNNASCIDSVKKGNSNVCLLFPPDIDLEDEEQDEVKIYIDESRINLVDTIVNRISSVIGVDSEQMSKDLTASLLTTITLTKKEVEQDLLKTINIKQKTDSLISDSDSVKSNVKSMDISMGDISISSVEDDVNTLYSKADDIKDDALSALSEALDIAEEGNYTDEYATINSTYNDIESKNINSSYNSIISSLSDATDEISDLEDKLSSAETKQSGSVDKLETIKTDLDSIKAEISSLKSSLEKIQNSISSIKVMSAESIVNPISTTINPVSTNAKKGTFLLPYLVVLVIMFIGIMLSGTSIVIDKMSSAAFRTFTCPTKDSFYLFAYYITNMVILFLQLLIIGGLGYLFIKFNFTGNIFLALLIMFLAATLFILLGMAFGYLLKSQEAVTIASLSFSSVLLFVSNLVIPLESTPLIVQKIASYNPFVILSDMLKKTILFNVEIIDLIDSLGLIVLYIIVILVLIFIIERLSKIVFFRKIHFLHKKNNKQELTATNYFRVSDTEFIKDKRELLKFLKECNNSKFREFVDYHKNDLAEWVKTSLGDKKLCKKLKKTIDKEKMSKILEKNIAKKSVQK